KLITFLLNTSKKAIAFLLVFNVYFQTTGQNLILNPTMSLLKEHYLHYHVREGYNFNIKNQAQINFVKSKDSNWHLPWSELSDCRYLVYPLNDSIISKFEFEINTSFPDSLKSKLIQGELCTFILQKDSIELSFNFEVRNKRRKYYRGVEILVGISNSPIDPFDIPTKSNDSVQIISKTKLNEHTVSKNEIVIEATTKIEAKYFFITLVKNRSNIDNYFYLSNFILTSKTQPSCKSFTY
ncbi:MAG: hypothetical protein IT244_06030, partial [Bacteroidia bacterium]|nr:hypothetical protein [Bacteroidia bacterium]